MRSRRARVGNGIAHPLFFITDALLHLGWILVNLPRISPLGPWDPAPFDLLHHRLRGSAAPGPADQGRGTKNAASPPTSGAAPADPVSPTLSISLVREPLHTPASGAALRLLLAIFIGAMAASPLRALPLRDSLAPAGRDLADTLIVVMGAELSSDYGRGALLGMEEGRRSVELLGNPLIFQPLDTQMAATPRVLARRLAADGAVAVVAALPDGAQAALEDAATAHGIVVMDARPVHPDSAAERPGVFRVGAPDSAYPAGAGTGAPRLLWHSDLFRYGAEQLNERYRRRFDMGMTAEAWAGWMAVKAVTEATLRAGGRTGPGEVLADPRTAFDGHKGAPLAFSGPRNALTQPLYVVEDGRTREIRWPEERAP